MINCKKQTDKKLPNKCQQWFPYKEAAATKRNMGLPIAGGTIAQEYVQLTTLKLNGEINYRSQKVVHPMLDKQHSEWMDVQTWPRWSAVLHQCWQGKI